MIPIPSSSSVTAGTTLYVLLTAAIISTSPATPRSFADGPLPGYTGGFDEPTCQQCHLGNDLNDPSGSLDLDLPAAFLPGQTYDITVELRRPDLERGGFQLAARVAEGPSAGVRAGTLHVSGPALQLVKSADGKVTYAQHTPEGTRAATPGSLKWTLRWTAPDTPAPVQFNVAANASNYDDSALDDYIYIKSVIIRN